MWLIGKPLESVCLVLQTQPPRLACVRVWDSIFNYPGNTARCSITLAMAVIKSSKIFISIRHPHATCIINAQRKDTGTFTTTAHMYTRFHHHIPSAHCSQLPGVYVWIQEIKLWTSHFEQHSRGRAEGSQTAFWDIIQTPTQQMCWFAPSLPWLSLGVFLLEKQHREFASSPRLSLLWGCCVHHSVYFSALLLRLVNTLKYLQAVCRRSQKRSDVSSGRRNIQTQHNKRLEVKLQTLSRHLIPEPSVRETDPHLPKAAYVNRETKQNRSFPFQHLSSTVI